MEYQLSDFYYFWFTNGQSLWATLYIRTKFGTCNIKTKILKIKINNKATAKKTCNKILQTIQKYINYKKTTTKIKKKKKTTILKHRSIFEY